MNFECICDFKVISACMGRVRVSLSQTTSLYGGCAVRTIGMGHLFNTHVFTSKDDIMSMRLWMFIFDMLKLKSTPRLHRSLWFFFSRRENKNNPFSPECKNSLLKPLFATFYRFNLTIYFRLWHFLLEITEH